MASMYRVRSVWSGFSGAPGYTNHYFGTTDPLLAGASLAVSDVRAFWVALAALFPDDVQINVETAVQIVEDSTGVVENELTAAAVAAVNGTSTAAYAAPVGASAEWRTSDFVGGRRVKGRTYIVPLSSTVFETDGTIGGTPLATLQTAASGLVAAASNMVVWHRPSNPGTSSDGSLHLVSTANVSDRAAVLRSRRD
jgi:hypothetical protein